MLDPVFLRVHPAMRADHVGVLGELARLVSLKAVVLDEPLLAFRALGLNPAGVLAALGAVEFRFDIHAFFHRTLLFHRQLAIVDRKSVV